MSSLTGITGGRLLTCEDGKVLERGAIVIEDQRIAWVGMASDVPSAYADVAMIDASGATVMPGLVDAHMHISFGEPLTEEELSIYTPAPYRAIRAAADAERVLLAGVTSACDPGGPYGIAVAVRDAVDAGHRGAPVLRGWPPDHDPTGHRRHPPALDRAAGVIFRTARPV